MPLATGGIGIRRGRGRFHDQFRFPIMDFHKMPQNPAMLDSRRKSLSWDALPG